MAGWESGDLEARRSDGITAWGGAKRSPKDAKRGERGGRSLAQVAEL
jgi:hypothetical protein